MPVVMGSEGRRRPGRTAAVTIAAVVLSCTAVAVVAIGASTSVDRIYWVEAAVWGAGIIVALAATAAVATRLLEQRERARGLARLQAKVGRALAEAGTLEETTRAMLQALGEALDVGL